MQVVLYNCGKTVVVNLVVVVNGLTRGLGSVVSANEIVL